MPRLLRFNPNILTALAGITASLPGAADAQVGIERRGGPADAPLPLPEFRAQPQSPFAAPDLNALPQETGRAATSAAFVAHDFEFHGASAVPTAQLEGIAAPFLNRAITSSDLLELRDAVTRTYIEAGYLNSGAVIPDQDVSDGVVDINLVEGRLAGVEVTGLRRLRASYVSSRVESEAILNRTDLEQSFERLASDPNVARINARLGPGARPGEAILALDVEEVERWTSEIEVATDRSPSVGGERAIHRSVAHNLIGWGDRLDLEWGATEGLLDVAANFTAPLTRNDLTLTLEASGSEAEVVEQPLNTLDIISSSYSARTSLTQPVFRGAHSKLTLGFGVSYQHAETELGGLPFSFSPGAVNGKTELTVARGTLDFVTQSPKQVAAVRSTFSYGIEALEPETPTPAQLDKNFSSLQLQAQYARATTESGQQLLLRLDLQVAQQSLFALEQFSFGGIDSVRGYRKNEALTDNGAVASIEYRAPLRDLAFWRNGAATGQPHWYGAIFVDGGYGWNTDLPDPQYQSLASAGVSLTWRPTERISAQIYAAAQLEELPDPVDQGVQDYGAGFRLTARLW